MVKAPSCRQHKKILVIFWKIQVNSRILNGEDFFFFFFRPSVYGVPGPGIGSKPQVQLIPDPLTHCAGLGIEPASWCCRDATNPGAPQQELLNLLLDAKQQACCEAFYKCPVMVLAPRSLQGWVPFLTCFLTWATAVSGIREETQTASAGFGLRIPYSSCLSKTEIRDYFLCIILILDGRLPTRTPHPHKTASSHCSIFFILSTIFEEDVISLLKTLFFFFSLSF